MPITLTLTLKQEAWLNAHVAAGEFASIEEAARQLITDRIAEIANAEGENDMAWAKPLADEAHAAVARGETITLEEHRTRNAERLAALRK
jgi:antitoxin ParD1/3/4